MDRVVYSPLSIVLNPQLKPSNGTTGTFALVIDGVEMLLGAVPAVVIPKACGA
jgi:hypothetical protein